MNIQTVLNANNIAVKAIARPYPGKPITEIIANGFFSVDNDWIVRYWNKSAEKLLGITAGDIIGSNIWEKFIGLLPAEFYTKYHKSSLKNIPRHFEEYWGEKGAWFQVITYYNDNVLTVSFKSAKTPSHVEAVEEPEDRLKMLNELYRYVTEVTNDCLWEWNLDGKEIFWIDGGHKRVFGYPIENALIPQSFWESLIHPQDKERIMASLRKIIGEEPGAVWEEEYRYRKSDGSYAYVHDRGHIVYEGGKASRMIGATQDITGRKKTELKLWESERKLSLIAKQTVNAVMITDTEGKISWVNAAFMRITGYEEVEVIGKKPEFLQGKETNPATVQYLHQQIKDRKLFDCEIINYKKSGEEYWMRLQGQPMFDENGNMGGYFALETDITERVHREDKLKQERTEQQNAITAAVLTAQENERKLLGGELHDNLNQVLSVAKLYIQMASSYDEKKDDYLEKACGFIVNVIEDIRRIAKTLITPKLHNIGLFDSIESALTDLQISKVKFEFRAIDLLEEDISEQLQLIIFRIVQEQLTNILKHANATEASIFLSRKEQLITLYMSDNGDGADPYTSTKGVGNINIRSRAELIGGSMLIMSAPGQGYILKVELPLGKNSA